MWRSLIELDSDDFWILVGCAWIGSVWAILSVAISMTWDLDNRWFDPDMAPVLLLMLRIVLLWPVWAGVQGEHAFNALGIDVGDAWFLLMLLAGIGPLTLVGFLHRLWTHSRQHA